jgi:crotonobetainyl-CoA:carnitine CoA-transferase CaiB-like acyl-CoA transferase
MSEDGWWETSAFFSGTNTNKRDLAIDLQTATGREVMLRLIGHCDALVENFSPRVMGQIGLDYESLRTQRPDIIMLRAPAFGITGPWTDRVGYAPTIDQASGLAWITGYPDEPPKMVGAASDAVGGMHATIALMLALEHRRRTGSGMLVESPQIGPGLNVTAEQVIEYAAHGVLLGPMGNRSWTVAPQGVYRSLDADRTGTGMPDDDWVAVSVENDSQWAVLCSVIGRPDLGADPSLSSVAGRRAQHDRIDDAISAWCVGHTADGTATLLSRAGVPAAPLIPPHNLAEIEAVAARNFYEMVHHPVAGPMRIPAFPIGMQHRPPVWNRTHAPCLGEHNRVILSELVGLSAAEIDRLEADNVIGNKTSTNLGW